MVVVVVVVVVERVVFISRTIVFLSKKTR